VLWAAVQARAETVSRSLSEICEGLADNNATAVGEAVLKCPQENTTAISTALAQACVNGSTAGTVASVGWSTLGGVWASRRLSVVVTETKQSPGGSKTGP